MSKYSFIQTFTEVDVSINSDVTVSKTKDSVTYSLKFFMSEDLEIADKSGSENDRIISKLKKKTFNGYVLVLKFPSSKEEEINQQIEFVQNVLSLLGPVEERIVIYICSSAYSKVVSKMSAVLSSKVKFVNFYNENINFNPIFHLCGDSMPLEEEKETEKKEKGSNEKKKEDKKEKEKKNEKKKEEKIDILMKSSDDNSTVEFQINVQWEQTKKHTKKLLVKFFSLNDIQMSLIGCVPLLIFIYLYFFNGKR